jgi:small subunit ribosomal protein S17
VADKGKRKELVGVVTSASSMDKTIVVRVERRFRHALYGKVIRRARKFVAHDEQDECAVGDTVKLRESRPLSKTKRWRLVEVLSKANERVETEA